MRSIKSQWKVCSKMKLLAIDPGNNDSAYCVIDPKTLRPLESKIVPNDDLLRIIKQNKYKETTVIVIEMVASYGMPVGAEVFETVFWIGQFYAAAELYQHRGRIFRMAVKMHLCHNSRAKDSNIRQALIDRFGPVGIKKSPGWFYGFKSDMWAAYAVGITYFESILKGEIKS